MKANNMKFLITLLAILMLVGTASAAVNNATVTAGSESSYTNTGAAGNSAVTAGGTTEANVSSTLSTSRWAGFYGSISANIVLADATSNWFRNWTVSDVSGSYVYASNVTNPNFASLAATTSADMSSWLTTAGASDNFANTFNAQESQTFNGQSVTANYTMTYNNAGTDTFKTYSLKDGSSNLIWAALAQSAVTGYNGKTVDYQLLVPVNGANSMTYYFYLELP